MARDRGLEFHVLRGCGIVVGVLVALAAFLIWRAA
jgi:hypothetical protein